MTDSINTENSQSRDRFRRGANQSSIGPIPLATFLHEAPLDLPIFFPLAIAMTMELAQLHERHEVHGRLTPNEFAADGSMRRLTHHEREGMAFAMTQKILPYLSPEQLNRWSDAPDSRSDLYALGVIFYEALTGFLPFSADDELGLFHGHLARTPTFSVETSVKVPAQLQRIILKLLAKELQARYQSAQGLLSDLIRSQRTWNGRGHDQDFPLGTQDIPRQLQLSPKLFGRQQEKAVLLAAFERVKQQGTTELVLVSGPTGVGKTALIQSLHEPVMAQGGLFIAGKFEELKAEVPFFTLTQTFRGLIARLLGESESRLNSWRHKLREALGQQGQLITNMIPSLEIIIGSQPPVPELPSQETQNRFHAVFKRFIGVFAAGQHPLVLFLDDLQWADASSLKLLEALALDQSLNHILFIGAMRSAKDHALPDLSGKVQALREASARVQHWELAPLQPTHLQSFLADSLLTQEDKVSALAGILHQKTDGNPFFFIQYVKSLVEEGLLALDARSSAWSWNIEAIQSKNYTDNVAEFMLERLRKLPHATQKVLQYAACMGTQGLMQDLKRLALADAQSWQSISSESFHGILLDTGHEYRFLHDWLQQAAYALLSTEEQKNAHLLIARQVDGNPDPDGEFIFNNMKHYQLARDLLIDAAERLHVARRSLAAAEKARALAANPSAREYSRFGLSLLPLDAWTVDYGLTLGLHRAHAASHWRCGNAEQATQDFMKLLDVDGLLPLDRLRIHQDLIEISTTQGRVREVLEQCRDGLAAIGRDFPVDPDDDQVREVYRLFRASLRQRSIESLLDLPPITDPLEKAAFDIMAAAIPAAILTSLNMGCYLCCKMVHSSMSHGTSDAAAAAYAYFAMILGPVFGEYQEAYRLGKVGYELAQKGAHTWRSRIYLTFGNAVNFWTRPMRTNLPYVHAARPAAQEIGDVVGACYSCNHLISTLLALGQPLPEVDAEITRGLEFVQTMNYPAIADILIGQQKLVRALQADPGAIDEDDAYTARVFSSPMTLLQFWYHLWKMQAFYLLERPDEACRAGDAARPLMWSSRGHLEEAEYAFYHALTLAQVCTQACGSQRQTWLAELLGYAATWQTWAHNSPENFSHKYHLIKAEIARLMHDDLDAIRHYEKAIGLAREHQFIQIEALGYDLAASFHEKAGFIAFRDLYVKEAKRCYQTWGAIGKLRALEARYPQPDSGTAETALDEGDKPIDIDMLALLRATQSISSEIMPNQLIEKLMRLLVEASGAERGCLVLARDDALDVKAEAETRAGEILVKTFTSWGVESFAHWPQAIFNYVQRTHDKLLIADARTPHALDLDDFLKQHPLKSILCLPILRNQVLVGMIYLENNLLAGAFTPAKLKALEIIASQAAISIENARLYDECLGQQEKLRATLESMTDGLIVADSQARLSFINDAAREIVGIDGLASYEWENRQHLVSMLDIKDAEGRPVPFDQLPLSRALHGETVGPCDYHIHKIQGRQRILRISASPMRQASGRILGAVMVLRDVTELTALDRLKDEFVRAMAHELKTPLLVVTGYFELFQLLMKKGAEPKVLEETMARIDKGLTGLKSLVTTLVDIGVIQLGKLKLHLESFDLYALGRSVMQSKAFQSSRHRIKLTPPESEPLMIQADRMRMTQVLTNLLQNAIKYAGTGDIELNMVAESDAIVVSIQDHGIGIPLDRQDRIFQRFYRAHAETEHDVGGMGVGLFLTHEIIQAHHGSLWFSSQPGEGSTFFFRLPRA